MRTTFRWIPIERIEDLPTEPGRYLLSVVWPGCRVGLVDEYVVRHLDHTWGWWGRENDDIWHPLAQDLEYATVTAYMPWPDPYMDQLPV